MRIPSLVALTAALAACGGGGGGGGSSTPPPNTQPLPPIVDSVPPPGPLTPITAPSYPPLELTEATVPEAVAIALRALEEVPSVASYTVFVLYVLQSNGSGPANFGSCPRPLPGANRITHYDVRQDGMLGEDDVVTTDFVPCTGSTGRLVIRPRVIDAIADRFEGRIEFISGAETADDAGTSAGAAASFDLVTSLTATPRVQTLSDLSIYIEEDGARTWITAGRVDAGAPDVTAGYSYAYTADVASSKLARAYRLATTPLRGEFLAVPSEGEIVVEALPARARIAPATDPADREDIASLALDVTGSGQYGAPTRLPWARLLRQGNLFRWYPNTRPRITRLEVTPTNPHRLDTLVPSYDAFDYDGDPLQLTPWWSINGARLSPPSPTLPPGLFTRGDVVELTLSAWDGVHTGLAERTIEITIGNAPPIVSASVTPSAPMSIQDLALSSVATDPDGDPLTTTYAWRIDGSIVADQDSAALSHTVHAKDDVVTGIVQVSDGTATTVAEASVSILDSPGNVSVPAPPASVSYGDVLAFNAVANDYDGDDTSTKDFVLVYGPAGMTVHPQTGVVAWTARMPMFEPSVQLSYGVSINEPGAGIATGSFIVEDAGHTPPLARGAAFHPHYDGARVGDFDGDGDSEALVIGYEGVYELEKAAGPGYRQTWASFLAFGSFASPSALAAGDIDADDLAEIFVAHGNTIVRYSGADRALADRIELALPQDYWCSQLELADLDLNGAEELLCLATSGDSTTNPSLILVLAADTLAVTKQYPLAMYGGFIAVANVDDDAALELVTPLGYVFDGEAVTDPASFATQWRHEPGFGWAVETGDVNGDGVAEIVALDLEPDTIKAFDARSESLRWTTPVGESIALHVADVTGDATAEVLVGAYWTGTVTVYQQSAAASATELFAVQLASNEGVGAIASGNLDADAGMEILVGGAGFLGVAGSNPVPQVEWLRSDGSTPEIGFGFLGGERLGSDLVYLTGGMDGTQRFARFATANGDIALGEPFGNWGVFDGGFGIVDYDGDGVHEALLATQDVNNVETRLLAYDVNADTVEWSDGTGSGEGGPADLAHADFDGDGNDELVILTEAGTLRVFDVVADTLLYERQGSWPASAVAAADLDGDGIAEIVATIDSRVVVLSRTATGFEATATSAQFFGARATEVTDIDGDGAPEIFVLYDGGGAGLPRLARLDRFLLLQGEATLSRQATHVTTETSSHARKNLLFWNSDFTSDLFAADPLTGAEIWHAPRINGFVGVDSVRFHDLAGNGQWSISVGNSVGATLTR